MRKLYGSPAASGRCTALTRRNIDIMAKRILALIGVIFLVAMYLSTLIFSLIDSPLASDLLKGSVAATILVPVVLYGFVLFSRLFGNDHDDRND